MSLENAKTVKRKTPVVKRPTQEALDNALRLTETMTDLYKEQGDLNKLLQKRIDAFDEILKKISRASIGADVISSHPTSGRAYLCTPGFGEEEFSRPMPQLSRAERAEQRETALHIYATTLESRLATVKALAEFAQEHKT